MKNKLMVLGMLCSLVVSEPACKKHNTGLVDGVPVACKSDQTVYQVALDQDDFLDHFYAMRSGNVSNLPSATEFEKDWNNDGCPDATGIAGDTAAMAGLLQFYQLECKEINPTKAELVEMLIQARDSKDPIEAQMYMLGVLCYNINHGKNNIPSEDLPTDKGTTL